MTQRAFEKLLEFSILKNFGKMQVALPYKTGNLSMNSFKLVRTSTGWKIYIDETIAPYAKYLDSKPKTAGWWEFEALKFLTNLSIDMKAILKE